MDRLIGEMLVGMDDLDIPPFSGERLFFVHGSSCPSSHLMRKSLDRKDSYLLACLCPFKKLSIR